MTRCSLSFFITVAASGLLFSRRATSAAMSRILASGSGASDVFACASASCLLHLDRLERQCAGLDGERQLVVVAVDDAPRTAWSTSVTLSWLAASARRPSARGTWRLNNCAAATISTRKMAALPTRCRNTNDALRRPPSDAGVRVRRDRAERSCVLPRRASSTYRRQPRSPCRGSCRRAGCWRGGRSGQRRLAGRLRCRRRRAAPAAAVAAGVPTVRPVWRASVPARATFLARRAAPRRRARPAGGTAGMIGAGWPAPGSGWLAPGARHQCRSLREAHGELTRIRDTRCRCRRWRGRRLLGQRRVQRGRRNTFGGFGGADDDPVACGVLHEVRGVAGRNHAEAARRLGQRGRGLSLEDVAFQRFLLLQQSLIRLTGCAELVGPLSGIGRQPQGCPQTCPKRSDDEDDERHPGDQRART